MHSCILVDCTLRDGGYYNEWDFDLELIHDYLDAMVALNVDFVEVGFRSLINNGFKGGCAYSSDLFLKGLNIPEELNGKIGVMINGSELFLEEGEANSFEDKNSHLIQVLSKLFAPKESSPVTLVRIACHMNEFEFCLPASVWLKSQGYRVGFNLMQIADRGLSEITELARKARDFPIDVLYFADSMGSLTPKNTREIVQALQLGWHGALGIHTHDNMGQAISNSMQALESGVAWVDSTVTGMGRGAGNAQTEYLYLTLQSCQIKKSNPTKLFELIRKYFKPMQLSYGWGMNPYYFLAGKYAIHPSYVQEMLSDNRYSEEDILAVINHLKVEGGKKFNAHTLESARQFYSGPPSGNWSPADFIQGKEVLIIGTGPGVRKYTTALENFIRIHRPFVIVLNTQKDISAELIDVRAACHPVRLLADCQEHLLLPQPLITPASMLPDDVRFELENKKLFDFGLSICKEQFEFNASTCILPTPLVVGYVLAIATSGKSSGVFLAGFDGYPDGDPRNEETNKVFEQYQSLQDAIELTFITPTKYRVNKASIYSYIN